MPSAVQNVLKCTSFSANFENFLEAMHALRLPFWVRAVVSLSEPQPRTPTLKAMASLVVHSWVLDAVYVSLTTRDRKQKTKAVSSFRLQTGG